MGLIVVSPATGEPIPLEDLQAWCSVEDSSFDSVLTMALGAAVSMVGDFLGQALGETGYEFSLDAFADEIILPVAPLLAVSAVTYLDVDGVEQTVSPDDYTTDLVSRQGRIVRNEDASWPDVQDRINAVRIAFTAGYDAAGVPLPDNMKLAVLMLANQWFENRDGSVTMPPGVASLLNPFRRIII